MSSHSPIHPARAVQANWVLARQTLRAGSLLVEHQVQPAGECALTSGLTHHLLVLELGHVSRQILRLGDREYDSALNPGELLLIPARTPLFGACETSDEVLAVSIAPLFLEELLREADWPGASPELLSGFKIRDLELEKLGLALQAEMQQTQWASQLYLDSLANLLAIHLLRNYAFSPLKLRQYPDSSGLSQARLRQAIDYIQAHLEQDFQLVDLAAAANLSQCYFASLFRQSMGLSPWQYVTQQRVERAKRLLQQHNSPIAEIALQCGFSSQSHFTQQFRKLVGTTPARYRLNSR